MRKSIPLSERKVMVSMKYGTIEALHKINDDISIAVELLLDEVNKKDAKIFERDSVIEKLANCIDGIDIFELIENYQYKKIRENFKRSE